ncbi:MAG TPA: ribonuclease III [Verrucomicrobiae bacterium]|nr:ribonuclease III [Verrucomicrobiae bacterium]
MTDLKKRLGRRFWRHGTLLQEALTHPSVPPGESGERPADNQRLEYLGDAVLQLLCTEYLYESQPSANEGELTKGRASLVNRQVMCALALQLDLGRHLVLSRSEEANGGRVRPSNLADAMEAVIGAIYLDGGWGAAQRFAARVLKPFWQSLETDLHALNPKGRLQEILQAITPEAPTYTTIEERGPGHARSFTVVVEWRGRRLASGTGKSKKEAESNAAATALNLQNWLAHAPGASPPPPS